MSIAKLSAAPEVAAYYLEVIANGRDDYYLSPGEAPGQWTGSAAARLGLTGEVEPDAFRSVLDGCDPATGDRLVSRRVPGFDLTLSAQAQRQVSHLDRPGLPPGRREVSAASA